MTNADYLVALISRWCSEQDAPLDLRFRAQEDAPPMIDDDGEMLDVDLFEGFAISPDAARLIDWLHERTDMVFFDLCSALRQLGHMPPLELPSFLKARARPSKSALS